MRSDKTRPAGIAMMALGLLAALFLLAGPASADTNASDGSVTSGIAEAEDGSTASGAAEAEDGSVASGCSEAEDGSTASGGECDDDNGHEVIIEVIEHERGHGKVHEAEVAKAHSARHLAITGSSTLPLAAGAAGLVLVGGLIVAATSDRRRALAQS